MSGRDMMTTSPSTDKFVSPPSSPLISNAALDGSGESTNAHRGRPLRSSHTSLGSEWRPEAAQSPEAKKLYSECCKCESPAQKAAKGPGLTGSREEPSTIFRQTGVVGEDRAIVSYLAEVVKIQQTREMRATYDREAAAAAAPVVRLDNSRPVLFKNEFGSSGEGSRRRR